MLPKYCIVKQNTIPMIEILIADDKQSVREILKSYIEEDSALKIIGYAENGQEAIDLTKAHHPDIILMDIEMPVMDGLTATQIISKQFVNTKVLIMSIHNEDNYLLAALQVGAKGYLKKNTPAKELVNAIYSAYKDYFQLGPGLLEKYLYKIAESRNYNSEIQELQSIIQKQKELLDSLNKEQNNSSSAKGSSRGKNRGNADKSNLNTRIATIEMQINRLSSRFEKLNKKSNFTQQFVAAIVVCNILLIILLLLLSLVF